MISFCLRITVEPYKICRKTSLFPCFRVYATMKNIYVKSLQENIKNDGGKRMELQEYPALLREKYQQAMEGFIYEGKEPEAKERLRHLFHNQRIYVSSISPEPEDWNVWTEECIQNANWSGLCQIIAQRGKSDMMPVIYGSYLHESNFHCMMECFACGNIQAMERILPPELAQVDTCHQPFFLAASHILIGLWYKDDAVLEWAIPNAEQFLKKKKSTLLEKAMTAFLLDLANGDMVKGSEDLLAVCKGYPRDQKYVLGVRPFCTLAHGLYCLAQLLLPEDTFEMLKMPEYKNFLSEFAIWRREHLQPDLSLWFHYPEDLELLNKVYAAPPAKLILFQHAPNGKKLKWYAHGVKWVENYVDELWNMGVCNE